MNGDSGSSDDKKSGKDKDKVKVNAGSHQYVFKDGFQ